MDVARLNLIAKNKGISAFLSAWNALSPSQQKASLPKLNLEARKAVELGLSDAQLVESLNSLVTRGMNQKFLEKWNALPPTKRSKIWKYLNSRTAALTDRGKAFANKTLQRLKGQGTPPDLPDPLTNTSLVAFNKAFRYGSPSAECAYYSLGPNDMRKFSSQEVCKFMRLFNKTYNKLVKDPSARDD